MDLRNLVDGYINTRYYIDNELDYQRIVADLMSRLNDLLFILRTTGDYDQFDQLPTTVKYQVLSGYLDVCKMNDQGDIVCYRFELEPDDQNELMLQEVELSLPVLLLMITGAVSLRYTLHHLLRTAAHRLVVGIAKVFNKVSRTLRKHAYYAYRYEVIKHNVTKCYQQCGIDPTCTDFSGITPEQEKCLTYCYLNYHKDLAVETLRALYDCLTVTDKIDLIERIRRSSDFKIPESELGQMCRPYMTMLNDLIDTYEQVVSACLKKVDEQAKWHKELYDALSRVNPPRSKQEAEMRLKNVHSVQS